jgi:hypothetical protein
MDLIVVVITSNVKAAICSEIFHPGAARAANGLRYIRTIA